MWRKSATTILFGSFIFILWRAAPPMLAQDDPPPQPFMETAASGTWHGAAYFGPESAQLTAPISFNIDGNGLSAGQIHFNFQYEGMTDNLIALMNEHGCVVQFDTITPGGTPASGYFMDVRRAVGTFSASSCYLEGYGDLNFGSAISGAWYAEHTAETGAPIVGVQPTAESPTETADPTASPAAMNGSTTAEAAGDAFSLEEAAFGMEVYYYHCSECHGYFGEGAPGVANLTEPKVQRMSDKKLLEVINMGVEGTEMEPWGRILTEEEKLAVIDIIRHPEVLREAYDAKQG